jgi:ribosomal-protein-alanine N-acetyltransferase
MEIPTITTPRLTLRAFAESDAESLHQILSEDGVLEYFPNTSPPPLDAVRRFISRQLAHWQERGFGWWAIERRDRQGLIGWSGLQHLPETDEVEIAYLLGRAFWGKGLATEAAKTGLRYGFEQAGLEHIVAIVHVDNGASQRVAQKLGMSFVDRSRYFGIDCHRYAIERSHFAAEVKP